MKRIYWVSKGGRATWSEAGHSKKPEDEISKCCCIRTAEANCSLGDEVISFDNNPLDLTSQVNSMLFSQGGKS